MGTVSLRQLLRRAVRARKAPPAGRPACRPACRPAVEELEARALPTFLAPLTGFNPLLPPSDGTGGAASALNSADGRYTVYVSAAANVVPGQVNTAVASNVFLYDRQTQITTLVSHLPGADTADTTGADGDSSSPRISADGRYVVYESTASHLVAGQAGPAGEDNVFLYDRFNNTNVLISHRAGAPTTAADDASLTEYTTGFGLGPDAKNFLLFSSVANDLVAGQQGPDVYNVFLYDIARGTTTLVSHNHDPANLTGADDDTVYADLTADGGAVVFQSFADDVVTDQFTEDRDNIFLYHTATGQTQLVSGVYENGANSTTDAAGFSFQPFISADGATVTYLSDAGDLVAHENLSSGFFTFNVYAYDTASGTTTLVSHQAGSPSLDGNGNAAEAVLSSDGSTIAFLSPATNLLPGQQNNPPPDRNAGTGNVFLYDVASQTLTLVSHAAADPAQPAGGVSLTNNENFADVSLSRDGSSLVYESTAGNLVDQQASPPDKPGLENVFLYDRGSGRNTLLSGAAGSATLTGDGDSPFAHLSADGNAVALVSQATTLDPTVRNAPRGRNLYVLDAAPGATPALASRSAFPATATTLAYGSSADGRWVVFTSDDPNVVPGQTDTNGDQDVFVLDRVADTVTLVSHTPDSPTTAGDAGSPGTGADGVPLTSGPVISPDGSWIAFVSQASNLVLGEEGERALGSPSQVYLFDNRPGGSSFGALTLVSHAAGSAVSVGENNSDDPVLSFDGSFLAFDSSASNLIEGFVPSSLSTDTPNVFLYDTAHGTTTLVSHPDGRPLSSSRFPSFGPDISDDGRYVVYQSTATKLVTGGPEIPHGGNVFLFDRSAGSNALVSHTPDGLTSAPPDSARSTDPVISHDGSTVAFVSTATDLVAGQQAGRPETNVFLYRVADGAVRLVSGAGGSPTTPADGFSDSPALNDDGSVVVFRSDATDLVAGQGDPPASQGNIFLFRRPADDQATVAITLVSHAAASATTAAAGDSSQPDLDGAGDLVVYLSTAADLAPGEQAGGVNSVFLYSVPLGQNALVSDQSGPTVLPTFLPIISRDVVVTFNVLSGSRGASSPFVNTVARLSVNPSTVSVADGSPPGTVVASLNIDSVFGQFVPAIYALPAVGDNGAFALGAARGQQPTALLLAVTASYAARPSYLVTVRANFGFGNDFGTLTVLVSQGMTQVVLPPRLVPRLASRKVGRKVRLFVELVDADTGVVEGSMLSPYQAPAYRNVQVRPGGGTQVIVTARKGKRTVSRALFG